MAERPLLSQNVTYVTAVALSLLISLGSILYAGFVSNDKDDGGRGGALAVVVSLCVFFLRRNFSERVFQSTLELYPQLAQHLEDVANELPIRAFSLDEMTELLLGMFGQMNVESDETHKQNITLFCTSLIGTVFWGFGDIPARLIIRHRMH